MAQHKLLYVEDNPANLKLVGHIVKRLGNVEFIAAETPDDGLQKALAHEPDLIILDINLPGMSGYELLELMRQQDAIKDAVILALSANAMPSDIARGKQAGFREYLTKPLDIRQFQHTIQSILADINTQN